MRDLEFETKGDLRKIQEFMLSYSDEYAKCKLQKALDTLRFATWHGDGLYACSEHGEKSIPYVGMYYVKRYIERHADDILEKVYEQKTAVGVMVQYELKNNHDVWFRSSTYDEYGQMDIGIHVPDKNKAEKTLLQYVKVSALQEVMGLTESKLIQEYNGYTRGREGRRMDRWSEPNKVFVYHGFYFSLICDDQGRIVDLRRF